MKIIVCVVVIHQVLITSIIYWWLYVFMQDFSVSIENIKFKSNLGDFILSFSWPCQESLNNIQALNDNGSRIY